MITPHTHTHTTHVATLHILTHTHTQHTRRYPTYTHPLSDWSLWQTATEPRSAETLTQPHTKAPTSTGTVWPRVPINNLRAVLICTPCTTTRSYEPSHYVVDVHMAACRVCVCGHTHVSCLRWLGGVCSLPVRPRVLVDPCLTNPRWIL
jgi:hypothetical protein